MIRDQALVCECRKMPLEEYDGEIDLELMRKHVRVFICKSEKVDQLYDRDRLEEYIPGSKDLFDGWPGSENWVVYRGNISKYQLKKLEHWNGSGWDEVKLR